MIFSIDYSCIDTPKWCFEAVHGFFAKAFSAPYGGAGFVRSCEFGEKQGMVLRRVGQLDGACHSGNMMGRLPLPARRFIWEALPEKGAPLQERVTAHQWNQS